MIHFAILLAIVAVPDTTRCTWEGRLPDRGEYQPVVSRPRQLERLMTFYRYGTKNDRMAAVQSMGQLADPAVIPLLAEAAADTSKHVVQQAVWALGRIQDPRVAPLLLKALHSSEPQIQQAAACGLGRTGGTEVLPELGALLGSTNVFVASAARWSIGRITEIPLLPNCPRN